MYRVEFKTDDDVSVYAKILVPPTEATQTEPFVVAAQEEPTETAAAEPSTPELKAVSWMPKGGAEKVIAGLVDALIKKENLSEISECMKDSMEVAEEVTEIVNLLKKKGIHNTIEAVKAMGGLLHSVPPGVRACEAMHEDFARIEEYISIFAHPAHFVSTVTKNFSKNHKEIFAEVEKTVDSLRVPNYEEAGGEIASIMIQTLGEFPESAPAAPESLIVT